MDIVETPLAGVKIIRPKILNDSRGWFSRTFCKNIFQEASINFDIVQMNQSFNAAKGTFRGLHFQKPPFTEQKLVRCIAGSVTDVVVDLRKGSATFLQHLFVTLSAENKQMIFIPGGIAHGFLTLEDNSSLIYHHDEFYRPEAEAGICYSDKKLNLTLPARPAVISERDTAYPQLSEEFTGLEC